MHETQHPLTVECWVERKRDPTYNRSNSEPDLLLYLAIWEEIYIDFFAVPIVQIVLANHPIKLIIFDPIAEVIIQWIH